MSGEIIEVQGTPKVLETSGSAVANGAVVGASVGAYDKVVDGGGYPDGQFVLTGTFTATPVERSLIAVLARPLSVGSINGNTQIPEAGRPTRLIGYFEVDNVTTVQTMEFMATELPRYAWYYLYNVNTGQSLPIGWSMSVTPRTFKPAP